MQKIIMLYTFSNFIIEMPRRRKKNPMSDGYNWIQREVSKRIEMHYSKLFTFVKPKSPEMQWTLPKSEDMFKSPAWCDEVMMNLKEELNSVKDRLSDKDITLWRQHTQDVNIACKVVPYVRNKIKAEFCTQAWCKFYEILCTFPLVTRSSSSESLNSVHLCEAPGAFVAALNHYLALNYPHLKLSWLATTLNPYYEGNELGITIPDDRFILPTFEHWDFGVDNTGNLFCQQNRSALLEKIKSTGPVKLVTADGSVDCQDNPSEQESSVAMLHLLEAVTALQILAPLGNFIIKLFTCFEHTSICLLYLLNCIFQQVHIFKPGTSKRGNSEVYVIGLDFLGEDNIQNHLMALETSLRQAPSSVAMFNYHQLPTSFLQQMIACCTYFKNLQTDAILEHLSWFEHISDAQRRFLEKSKVLAIQTFLKKCALVPIPHEARVVRTKKCASHYFHNKQLKAGSLIERNKSAFLPWQQQLDEVENTMKKTTAELEINAKDIFCTILSVPTLEQQIDIHITFGLRFNRCSNSHFCSLSILQCWNQIDLLIRESGLEIRRAIHLDDCELADIILHHLAEFPLPCQFIVQHPSCTCLARHLQQCCTFTDHSDTTAMKVYLTDLRYVSDSWIPVYSAQNIVTCLENYLSVLEQLHMQDHLILLVDVLLTRVDASLLYILHQMFQKVILLSVSTCKILPLELIVCVNYIRPFLPLNAIKLKSAIQQKGNDTILEVLPISNLFDEPFFSTIFSFNCYALSQRATYLLNHLQHVMTSNK